MRRMDNKLVLLRDAQGAEWLQFENPHQVETTSQLEEVLPLLRKIESLVEKNGWHAAGFISYEAALAFDQAFRVHPARGLPLLWFGLYAEPLRSTNFPQARIANSDYTLNDWVPGISRQEYENAIETVKNHIAHGDTYQVNFTFRFKSQLTGHPLALFADMIQAQPVGYPAYVDTGRHILCSASPELFFQRQGQDVTCRPMKGTARRGRTLAEDEAQADWLRTSEKNRAENVMIVDMIRNDLGRIADTGTVHVPALFTTERYRTLWQMTSTVTAQTDATLADLLTALFPCASITGAPKVSTMNIISQLESSPRAAYTGCIGYLSPGRKAQFNVAIRTVSVDTASGEAEYGVGSGIVWDSTAADEYDEALLKARVITRKHPTFDLLETLRWTHDEGYFLRERHLQRLRDSALYFGFQYDETRILHLLSEQAATFDGQPQRVRLLLHPDGSTSHQATALPQTGPRLWHAQLAAQPVQSEDIFLYHKTTRRITYEQARAACPGADETLLFNERGELTEFTIGNLVAEIDGQYFTPPIMCGLLPGTLRAELLETGQISERILERADLARASRLFLINSVRGWQEICLDP